MSLGLRALAAALVVTAAAAAAGGCGGEGRPEDGGSAPTVAIKSYKYSPAGLTVKAGTTVTIANRDSSQHTVSATRAGAFDSGTIGPNASGEVKFTKAGTFTYICQFHPFMKGTVTVTF